MTVQADRARSRSRRTRSVARSTDPGGPGPGVLRLVLPRSTRASVHVRTATRPTHRWAAPRKARSKTSSPVHGAAPSNTGPSSASRSGTTTTGEYDAATSSASPANVAGTTTMLASADSVRSRSGTGWPRRPSGTRLSTAARTSANSDRSAAGDLSGAADRTHSGAPVRRASAVAQRSARWPAMLRSVPTTTAPVGTRSSFTVGRRYRAGPGACHAHSATSGASVPWV